MARRGARLGTSVLDLDVDDSRFSSGLDRNRRRAMTWTDTLGRDVRRGIGQGIGIAGGVGVAMAVSSAIQGVQAVVAGSISAAMEWESAFAGVRKTVDASPAEFAELEASIRELSTEIPIAATELAGLAEAAGALGVAKKDILEFTRITAMIGTTTDVSSDQAATSLGQLSNVLGLTGQDYERFGSTLVDLGNKGASTESQILEIASRAGAGSKLIGMANDETLAWASSVANLGIEVEAGGSALQKFFLDTAKAVADGGDKLERYAEVAGMSGAAFKKAFEEDASGALQAFLAGLGELAQGDQLKVLEELDFNDVRITRTLLGLAGNTDNLTNSLDVASEAWEDNTALAVEAGKRFDTTASKMQILGNRVNDLAITFGEELLPHLATLATWGVEQLEQFAGEAGRTATEVGGAMQYIAGHFGEQGDAVNQLADDMEEDFMQVNDAVVRYMSETGRSFSEALRWVERYGTGTTAAMQEAGEAIDEADLERRIGEPLEDGVARAETALLDGAAPLGDAADVAFGAISKEAQEAAEEARKAVIEGMTAMLANLSNLFETDESVRDAWQGLIDRMQDPYTEAERKADIFSQNTIDAIRGAIQSGDPDITADTVILVNNMLAQIALLEPGALETGQAVPPALQGGMDEQMSALITWIEENVTRESLSAMSLAEAQAVGLEGIYLYAKGMELNALVASGAAEGIAIEAARKLWLDASPGGKSVIATWIAGMVSGWDQGVNNVDWIVSQAGRRLGQSLPTAGPLKGGAGSGGRSIGSGWIGAVVDSIGAGLGALESQVGEVSSALGPMTRLLPTLPGLDGISTHAAGVAGAGALGTAPQVIEYHMHYGGRELVFDRREEMLEELESIARFHDGGTP